ncbi:HPF/RaiA family ribosome-associated protein [Roseomonas sp. M0104]|uniref:HPF/RaiA family ribosome-associated protein n=1 Tax=Teichococcus coralli TaxID=2545983 RepID=A0A845B8Y7_9PROT|nr:HPF/RaiA family ribosome-associated protein [Pseudoroseomonas coralli]MXP62564.1 HPF/RaiA family ribosome-associated protein [Pseudoroseomonas coralli]
MDRPLEIAFHNMPSSPSLEAEIRQAVDKLEKRYTHLIGCRVSVEALHQQHQTGNIHEVHITLSVPGRDLAVSREPQRAKERYANPDVRTSMRDAFKAAERQLEAFKGKLREDTTKPGAEAVAGQVTLIEPGQDHGFILTNTGTQLYFHRDSVTDGRFEDLHEGDRVHYVEEQGSAGPTATKVRTVSPKPVA